MDTTRNSPPSTPLLTVANSLSSGSEPLPKETLKTLRLEELPYDVRRPILSSVYTIADLSALIRASPIFYRDYAVAPEKWLYHCLELELGNTIVDALTVHLATVHPANTVVSRQHYTLDEYHRSLEDMRQFISSYHSRVLSPIGPSSVLPNKTDIVSIVTFHCTVVMPLVFRFMEWTQGHFEGLSLSDGLSHTEMKRILRGFYRYQLFCKVFNVNCRHMQTIQPYVSADEKLKWFLGIYEPWETEEVLCVYDFVNDKYHRVLEDTRWGAATIDSHLSPRMLIVTGMSARYPQVYKTGLGSLGLTVLLNMFNAADHKTIENLVAHHIQEAWDPWVEDAVSRQCQARRRGRVFSARDRAEVERAPIPFTGDSEDSPPLAWVTIWKGTSSNRFGQWIPRSFREWGYVMWDSGRMITAGGIAALEEKWVEVCTVPNSDFFVDPRDR
ncbi:uncharacterized protein B0J16DRAFT_401825 [Fusarium flagelliforme]|uniref:uncharacterized protein n=1 Tax=Fusarium flagelliforme TaxID=2675880 RepID=UPI001E8E6160|nr:uncharacterized protein B0J16DRAFT_401825 [Fusarium flagelliforme]KAH7183465.1 hypothetical protein B0J16DRAFT_401825 [Fusarium flagelliforme]